MAGPFTRRRGGRVELRLDEREAEVMRRLFGDLDQSLGTGETSGDLERLFPPAYIDDPSAQAEFSRLETDDLRNAKRAAIVACMQSLDGAKRKGSSLVAHLDDEGQQAWLRTLNDLRLSLGTRLGVTEDPYETELEPSDDPRAVAMHLYLSLGWLQETLVETLLD